MTAWREQKYLKIRISLLFILAIGVLVYEIWLFATFLHLPSDQIGIFFGKHVIVEQARPQSPLLVGDIILEINGHDVNDNLLMPFHWRSQLATSSTSGATYTVQRDNQTLSIDVGRQPYTASLLLRRGGALWIVGLVVGATALILITGQGNSLAARLISLAFVMGALNQVNNLVRASGANIALAWAWFFIPIDAIAIWITFSATLHAMLLFPEIKAPLRRYPWLPWMIHLMTPVISVSAGLLFGGDTLLERRNTMFAVANPMMLVQILLTIASLTHTYMTSRRPGVRNQIRWIIWGICIAIIPWTVFYAIPSVLFNTTWLPLSLINLPLILIPITFLVSIFRFGLMDVDRWINRTLVYGLAGGTLAIVYFLVVFLVRDFAPHVNGQPNHFLAGVIGTLVLFVVYNPLRIWVQHGVNRTFYREQLDFNRILRDVGQQLSTTIMLDETYRLLTNDISHRLGLAYAHILLRHNGEVAFADRSGGVRIGADSPLIPWLTQHPDPLVLYQRRRLPQAVDHATKPLVAVGGELCLPLLQQNTLVGLYLFGSKHSGNLLNRDEVNNLVLLGHQAAAAIRNAQLYAELQEYNRSLEARVAARTTELQTERNRLDTIIQNVADGLVVTDAKGYIVLANAAFTEMVRLPMGLILGTALADVLPSEVLHSLIEKAFAAPGDIRTENIPGDISVSGAQTNKIYKASACALIPRALAASEDDPRPSEPGALGVVTVLRDITHEHEVDRMKTDFISMVSHELRTPLTSILGFTKLIRRAFDREIVPRVDDTDKRGQRAIRRVSDNLDIIASEGDRLTRLINDVLDIAKMEAGRTEWHMDHVPFRSVIDTAVKAIHALSDQKGLRIIVDADDVLPDATVDHDRMVQVMTNLLSNAIKFTEDGQITVRARQVSPQDHNGPALLKAMQRPLAPNDWLWVSVHDTGVGIPEGKLPDVFEKFKQVSDALTDRPQGTGLGLPICREIVEHHEGRVWVESVPGVGSIFQFVIPLGKQTLHELSPDILIGSGSVISAVRPGAHILTVDDEDPIRALLRQELTDAGYRISEARDGMEALDKARIEQPDLILLDIKIPRITGFDVVSVLKGAPETADIPIVILSGVEDRERGFRLGADGYLTKPWDTTRLLATLAEVLDRTKSSFDGAQVPGIPF